MFTLQLLINGKWRNSSNGETARIVNPATEQVEGEFHVAQDQDLDEAAEVAVAGLKNGAGFRHSLAAQCCASLRNSCVSAPRASRNRSPGKTAKPCRRPRWR